MKVSQEDFQSIAIECNLDLTQIIATLKKRYPDMENRPNKIAKRVETFRRKGLLPLASGNSVSVGEILKGSSTLYDEAGNVKLQWVKTDVPKQQMLDSFNEAIDKFVENLPTAPPVLRPLLPANAEEIMSVYTIGDAHLGLLGWAPEVGEDHDLEISKIRHIQAMSMLVSQSNASKEAFIIDVGDFFHSDNVENRTAASGHSLDVDGRYAKVLEVGLLLTTNLIDLALQKHETVRWRSAIGNHNEHSALMMNQFVKAYYRNEPRVIVHDSPSTYMYHQFGKNLIGITHGNKAKADKLGELMAVDCQDIWSSTKYRYWYTGHVHHQSVKEYPSCVVETFRTLAGKDAWHSAQGYRSGQDMKCITLHKDHGEISRNTVSISQLS